MYTVNLRKRTTTKLSFCTARRRRDSKLLLLLLAEQIRLVVLLRRARRALRRARVGRLLLPLVGRGVARGELDRGARGDELHELPRVVGLAQHAHEGAQVHHVHLLGHGLLGAPRLDPRVREVLRVEEDGEDRARLQLRREEDGQRPLARLDAVGGEALGELVLDLLDERVVALQPERDALLRLLARGERRLELRHHLVRPSAAQLEGVAQTVHADVQTSTPGLAASAASRTIFASVA